MKALTGTGIAAAWVLLVWGCGPGLTGPCGDGPLLSEYPVEWGKLAYIRPLGDLDPPGHTIPAQHMYWNFVSPGAEELTLRAPGPVTVTRIERSEYDSRTYEYDYSIEFSVCNSVTGYFHHVSDLSAALHEAAGSAYEDCETKETTSETITECHAEISRSFDAGEALGIVGDIAATMGVDFGMTDARVTHSFINQERMTYLAHQVAAYDYYPPEMQAQIAEKIGTADGSRRTAEPLGGKVDYDLAGTAQGVWFKVGGTGFFEGYAVALVEETVFPDVLAFSIGEVGSGQDSKVLHFSPNTSGSVNPAFDQVKASSGTVCYDSLFSDRTLSTAVSNVIVVLQYGSDGKLKLETQTAASCGSGPSSFSGSEVTFER